MNKYNVGDVVKLRDDLEVGEEYGAVEGYGAVVFLYSMETLKNKALRIDSIDTEDDECVVYEIDGWWISEEMIEGLWGKDKEKQDKLKLIDVLNMIAKGELKEGTKVKIRDYVYVLIRQYCSDVMPDLFREDEDGDEVVSLFEDYYLSGILNDEVELIEPPCEDEHIVGADKTIEPDKIEELKYKLEELQNPTYNESWLMNCIRENRDKLNEVIRMVNAITNLLN